MSFTALPKEIFQILGARGHGACIHSGHPAPEPLRFPASFYRSGIAFPESADPCVTRDAQRSNDQHPMHIKAVIQDDFAEFYVDGIKVLDVKGLKHGSASRGNVGLYVDIGTDGFFKNLSIDYQD